MSGLFVMLALTIQAGAQIIPTDAAPPGPRTGIIVGQVVDAGNFLAAPTDLETGEWNDSTLLEQLVPSSAKVTLRDGEMTKQDFRLGGAR